ncbi:MAG: hypothetical protein ACTHOI_12170 [Sphingomicrobium sp.]
MNRSAFLLIVPLLAACNVHSKNPANDDDNVTISADGNGQVAFNLPFAKGDIKLPPSVMHDGEMDIDGVKMIPGASMTGFHLDSSNDVSNVNMSFTAPQSPDEVRSYFLDQFRKQGAQVALAGDSVTGKSKDGSPFTIKVGPAATGSQGSIVIQDKD